MKHSITSSKLPHRVTVLTSVQEQNDRTGEKKLVWRDFQTKWAYVQSLGGSEQLKSTGQVGVAMYTVKMRFCRDISIKSRFRWEDAGTVMEVTGVTPIPESNEIQFSCTAVVK